MTQRPRRRFGQHFLVDPTVVDRIIAAVAPLPGERVVEIGPGKGALTRPLLERLGTLLSIEIDRDLVALLKHRWPELELIADDVLKVDFTALAGDAPLRLLGNLPYNISTPLLLHLLDCRDVLCDVHVMVQKEVATRLAARAGTRAYGRLSVMMQAGFTIDLLFEVPPEAFSPPPKVQSAVLRLTPLIEGPGRPELASLARATQLAFASKRKMLRSNLKGHVSPARLQAAGIDPAARAETLDLAHFRRLAALLDAS